MQAGKAFEFLVFGFVLAVATASFFQIPSYVAMIFLVIGIFCIFFWFADRTNSKKAFLVLLGFGCLGVSLAFLRFNQYENFDHGLLSYVDQNVSLVGKIIEEPDERESNTHLMLSVSSVDDTKQRGTVLLIAERYPKFNYGDVVNVSGLLSKPQSFLTDTGKVFDYEAYLKSKNIDVFVSFPKISLVEPARWSLVGTLIKIKNVFTDSLIKSVKEPNASYLAGLIVGARHSLSVEWNNYFRKVGLAHVVVLSGYNLTIIADSIYKVLSFFSLGRFFVYGMGITSIILFAIMAGPSATVVRATLMALIVVIAKATGRVYGVKRALLATALIMLLVNPKSLVFDLSFQLSFLATIALVYVAPLIESRIPFGSRESLLKGILVSTISTQIVVLPLILFKSGVLSLIAPISNLLILPLIPTTMFFGAITGITASVIPVIALPFAFVSYLLSGFELWFVKFFANLPLTSVEIKVFPVWLLILSYTFLIWMYYKLVNRENYKSKITNIK